QPHGGAEEVQRAARQAAAEEQAELVARGRAGAVRGQEAGRVVPGLRRAGQALARQALGQDRPQAAGGVRRDPARAGRAQLPAPDSRQRELQHQVRQGREERHRGDGRRHPQHRGPQQEDQGGPAIQDALEGRPLGRLRRRHRRAEHARELPGRVQQDHQPRRLRRALEEDEEEAGREGKRERVTGRPAVAAIVVAAALAAPVLGGCQSDCCTVDSFPILLGRAPSGVPTLDPGVQDGGTPDADGGAAGALPDAGALWARAGLPGGAAALKMVVDTATPLTFLNGASSGQLQTSPVGFDLYSQGLEEPDGRAPLRARFPNWDLLTIPLQPVGDGTLLPDGVLGADVLRNYSVELRFAAPCPPNMSGTCAWMTLWNHLAPDPSFLEDAGF